MNSRERILAKLDGQPVDRLPNMAITMMFACAQTESRYSEYATDYRVLAEGQKRTADKYGIDHVSVISDPAIEAADCGAVVRYYDDQPPAIDESVALFADKSALLHFRAPAPASGKRMTNRIHGVELLKSRVKSDKLVEGWIEGPCAEAADLRGINNLMLDCMDDPEFVVDLFEHIVHMQISFAHAQIEAGADLIGIGDAAASLVGPAIYDKLVWSFEKRLVDAIHVMGARVRLHICGNTRRILRSIGTLNCDMVDLDYLAPISAGRAFMQETQVLLGNIDPVRVLQNGTEIDVYSAIAACHAQAGDAYVIGAGCEVPRDTPPDNLLALHRYALSTAKRT